MRFLGDSREGRLPSGAFILGICSDWHDWSVLLLLNPLSALVASRPGAQSQRTEREKSKRKKASQNLELEVS